MHSATSGSVAGCVSGQVERRAPSRVCGEARRLERPRPRGRLSAVEMPPVPTPDVRRPSDGSVRFLHILRRAADAMGRIEIARRARPSRRPAGSGAPAFPAFARRLPPAAAGLLLVWACLLLLIGGLLAAPAGAQTVQTLVSNTGQTASTTSYLVGELAGTTFASAQKFTTGDAANGYTLSTVDLAISNFHTGDDVRVSIYDEDASGNPGSSLHVLTNPSPITNNSLNTFTAPANVSLAKETDYFVVVEAPSGSGDFSVNTTSFDAEDAGAASGWSIEDGRHSYNGNWSYAGADANSLRIAFKGTVNTATASDDATLASLAVKDSNDNAVSLTPDFDSATTTYTADVANTVTEIVLTAGTTDGGASVTAVTLDGTAISDTDFSDGIISVSSLIVGANTIVVTVTAANSDTETYTVTVTRAAAVAPEQTEVAADWPLIPSGVSAGGSFRLIFATSTTRNATSDDIAVYNTLVQNRAAAGHSAIQTHSSGFRVVGCTADVDARDNTSTTYTSSDKGVPVYWLNGNKAADDYEDFYDGSWDDETNPTNESGTARNLSGTSNGPFTGCGHDGTEAFSGSDSRALGESFVRYGIPNSTDSTQGPLNSDQAATSGTPRPFYGLSPVFKVAASAISVTIDSQYERIGGGLEDLVFTLVRAGATTESLEVTVTLEQDEDWLADADLTHTVTFAVGESSKTLTIPAEDFSLDPDTAGDLTATVTGTGVSGGSDTVEVVSTADPPLTVKFDQPEYYLEENDADAAVYAVATLDPAYPRAPTTDPFFLFSSRLDTATSPKDYAAVTVQTQFFGNDFELDAGTNRLVAREAIPVAFVDDMVYEGTEHFTMIIEPGSGLRTEFARAERPDGSTCRLQGMFHGGCSPVPTYSVYITDEEDREFPVLSLTADPMSIAEEDDSSTMDIVENVSTLTVAITNGKTYATDQTITLTFDDEREAVYGTDYSVTPVDAGTENGHQVVLLAGESSVALTITATGNDTAYVNVGFDVTGALGGTEFARTFITILDDESTGGNTAATGKPAIEGTVEGTPIVGRALTVNLDDVEDDEGKPTVESGYFYQWVRVDTMTVETPLSVSPIYTPVTADVGSTIKVRVSFTDADNNPEGPLESDAVGPVAATFNAHPATGQPGIEGVAQVGNVLTAQPGDMADGDGLPGTTFPDGYTFQWVSVDDVDAETDIMGATAFTYVPGDDDVGNRLKVKVSFTDGGDTVETLASDPVGPAVAAAGPCPRATTGARR